MQAEQGKEEKYTKIADIGKGSFGVVSKIRRNRDGKIFVWKEIGYAKMSEREKEQLVAEVNILRELKHDNIVRYHDRVIDRKKGLIYLIMEYCEEGDLRDLLKRCRKKGESIAEDVIWRIVT